jgi:hypothetical protein
MQAGVPSSRMAKTRASYTQYSGIPGMRNSLESKMTVSGNNNPKSTAEVYHGRTRRVNESGKS